MPVYEYEPEDGHCLICAGRFETLQGPNDAPLEFCPTCGMPCRRIISKAQIKVRKFHGHDHAAKKGFATYKRQEHGVWERTSGEGVDYILGTDEDREAVKKSQEKPAKKLDLDAQDP